jgi:GNAT superfamily N-acetyltransferase
VYRRFLAHRRTHPRQEVSELVDLDDEENMALVALPEGSDDVIGIARYDVNPASGLAELAFLVRDDWQNRGLGTALMRAMIEIARARGLPGFELTILEWNKPMLALVRDSGLEVRSDSGGGVRRLAAYFPVSPLPEDQRDARKPDGGR